MDRDRTTRTGARAPGVGRHVPLSWRRHTEPASSTLIEGLATAAEDANVGSKPERKQGMPGVGLTCECEGKAPTERPALEPYWGKLAVRNLRGDDGNVGIIRSPIRAIVLPERRLAAPCIRPGCAPPRSVRLCAEGS